MIEPSGGILSALRGRRIVVCVGAGGVGKTTVAAAIALDRAMIGEKALVCTIDPARRLANALGLKTLGNVESQVPAQAFADAGLRPRGTLFAMMLDVKRTWDDLVARHAPTPARRDRILKNRLYVQMSSVLAGSQEYMAMEKLYELSTDRDYNLIVLDTPPTAHALDFLDAPDRVLDFVGNDAARRVLAPALGVGRLGLRIAQMGGGFLAKALARFTGEGVLEDLGEFLQNFQGMYEGFKERASAVRSLLSQPKVGFVLVASPSHVSIDEALSLGQRLFEEGMPVAGLVANRVTPNLWPSRAPLPGPGDLEGALTASRIPGASRDELAARLARTLAEHQALAAVERASLDRLFARMSLPRAVVPRLPSDVHDLGGLARLSERL